MQQLQRVECNCIVYKYRQIELVIESLTGDTFVQESHTNVFNHCAIEIDFIAFQKYFFEIFFTCDCTASYGRKFYFALHSLPYSRYLWLLIQRPISGQLKIGRKTLFFTPQSGDEMKHIAGRNSRTTGWIEKKRRTTIEIPSFQTVISVSLSASATLDPHCSSQD